MPIYHARAADTDFEVRPLDCLRRVNLQLNSGVTQMKDICENLATSGRPVTVLVSGGDTLVYRGYG